MSVTFSLFAVSITVINHAPVAVNDSYGVEENQVLFVEVPGVLVNDSDADGDAASRVGGGGAGIAGALVGRTGSAPAAGGAGGGCGDHGFSDCGPASAGARD